MKIETRYNEELEGIEIIFPEKPDGDVLSSLKKNGFRYHRLKRLWYARITPSRKAFAEELGGREAEASEVVEGEEERPRYEAGLAELDKRNFSKVRIEYDDLDGDGAEEEFVIFEPSEGRARRMAARFGKKRHGAGFRKVRIYSRNHVADCRKLFLAGRVIRGEDLGEGSAGDAVEAVAAEKPLIEEQILPAVPGERRISMPWSGIYDSLVEVAGDLACSPGNRISARLGEGLELSLETADEILGRTRAMLTLYREEGGSKIAERHVEMVVDPAGKTAVGDVYEDSTGVRRESMGEEGEDPEAEEMINAFLELWLKELSARGPRFGMEEEGERPRPQARSSINERIAALIAERDASGEGYSDEDKELLRSYTGLGGLASEGESERGVLYEFYTPAEVVRRMWGLAMAGGYEGGPALEPSCGTGILIEESLAPWAFTGYETNPVSARIAELLNPEARIVNAAFETRFFRGNIHLGASAAKPEFDLVIGNPPYGPFTGRWAGLGEKRATRATRYEDYFVLRGVELLRPGGLMVMLLPSSFLRGGWSEAKRRISRLVERPVDAWRLPNGIFKNTDIGTDLLVLKRKKQ